MVLLLDLTSSHITPVLASLHWLPMTARSDFKGAILLTYKTLHGSAASYLKDLIILYSRSLCPFGLRALAFFLYQRLKRNQQDRERSPIEGPIYGIVCHL